MGLVHEQGGESGGVRGPHAELRGGLIEGDLPHRPIVKERPSSVWVIEADSTVPSSCNPAATRAGVQIRAWIVHYPGQDCRRRGGLGLHHEIGFELCSGTTGEQLVDIRPSRCHGASLGRPDSALGAVFDRGFGFSAPPEREI